MSLTQQLGVACEMRARDSDAAYGYGGNGITFSFLAAQLIGNLSPDRARSS